MGLGAKKFGMAEYHPKGYLHGKNEQNRKTNFFWWWNFILIKNGMPLIQIQDMSQFMKFFTQIMILLQSVFVLS